MTFYKASLQKSFLKFKLIILADIVRRYAEKLRYMGCDVSTWVSKGAHLFKVNYVTHDINTKTYTIYANLNQTYRALRFNAEEEALFNSGVVVLVISADDAFLEVKTKGEHDILMNRCIKKPSGKVRYTYVDAVGKFVEEPILTNEELCKLFGPFAVSKASMWKPSKMGGGSKECGAHLNTAGVCFTGADFMKILTSSSDEKEDIRGQKHGGLPFFACRVDRLPSGKMEIEAEFDIDSILSVGKTPSKMVDCLTTHRWIFTMNYEETDPSEVDIFRGSDRIKKKLYTIGTVDRVQWKDEGIAYHDVEDGNMNEWLRSGPLYLDQDPSVDDRCKITNALFQITSCRSVSREAGGGILVEATPAPVYDVVIEFIKGAKGPERGTISFQINDTFCERKEVEFICVTNEGPPCSWETVKGYQVTLKDFTEKEKGKLPWIEALVERGLYIEKIPDKLVITDFTKLQRDPNAGFIYEKYCNRCHRPSRVEN